MLILRRISKKDSDLEYITGNKAFDEINPDGTLKNYLDQDLLNEGDYLTYLLFETEEESGNFEFLALLRFKYTSIEEYIQELVLCKTSENDLNIIKKKIEESNLKIVYLSRIGVVKQFQEMNISQIMINFFEYLIAKNRDNVLIYVKINFEENLKSSFDIFWNEFNQPSSKNYDENGNFNYDLF